MEEEKELAPLEDRVDLASYYRPVEVAGRLGVKEVTVWNWIRTGKLQAVRIAGGRNYLVPREALMRFLEPAGR